MEYICVHLKTEHTNMVTQSYSQTQNIVTPSGNTGSERQSTRGLGFGYQQKDVDEDRKGSTIVGHVDYLILCGTIDSLTTLEAIVWAAFGARFDWMLARPGTRGKFYELNAQSPNGLTLSLNTNSNGSIEYRLAIGGKPIGHITTVRLHEFGQRMLLLGAKCTRFDWAIDDYNRTLDVDVMHAECIAGNRHGFDSYTYYSTGSRRHKSNGKTLYLGSTATDFFSRIYDKNVESNGEINAIRWEAQTADGVAHSFFTEYFSNDRIIDAARQASQRAIGKYRFVEPVSEVLKRCPDLEWWHDFVTLVGGQIRVPVPRLQTMVTDKIIWVERQVASTLALISRCKGMCQTMHWLKSQMEKEVDRHRDKHNIYVQTWLGRIKVEKESLDYHYTLFEA